MRGTLIKYTKTVKHAQFIKWVCIYLFFVLFSCRKQSEAPKAKITYWTSNNGGEINFTSWATEKWNAGNMGKTVHFQPIPEGQSSEEMLLAAVVAGTTPDIYSNIWQGLVDFYSKSGVLVALDTLNGFMDYIQERCDSSTIQEITAPDGHIYQVPWKINPIMTIYNERLLNQLGADSFPTNYSDYLRYAEKFCRDTNGDGYIDQWFGNTSVKLAWYQRLFNFYPLYLAATGGKPLIQNGKAVFNNPEAVGVFRFLQTLYSKNFYSRQTESAGQDMFIAQKYASKWTGPWEIEYLDKFNQEGFSYSFAPMPVPDGHKGPVYTYCDPKSFVIFKTCPHPQNAFEFIKFMTSEEGDLKFLQETKQLPRRKNISSIPQFSDFFSQNPKMATFADQSYFVRGADHSVSLVEVFDIISQEYEACVLYQRKSAEQAISDAERAVNVLLRHSNK